MAYLGTVLTMFIFAMLMPDLRGKLMGVFDGAGDWMAKGAPLSYFAVAAMIIVPILASIMVMRPKPEPEEELSPLAKLKRQELLLED